MPTKGSNLLNTISQVFNKILITKRPLMLVCFITPSRPS